MALLLRMSVVFLAVFTSTCPDLCIAKTFPSDEGDDNFSVDADLSFVEHIPKDDETEHLAETDSDIEVAPGGGVYVRWGRTVCPRGSGLVYEGVVGGAFFNDRGAGANYQCLPLEPRYDYDLVVPGFHEMRAYMLGAEYQPTPMSDPAWADSKLNDHGATCAVCMATGRPTILMIPARNVCPPRWTLEYNGLLMAEHYNHHRSEFICVDRNPETVPRTSSDANGALLFIVESRCRDGNSLPCGPYVDGYELTCAVCSM